jgi:hypothetical protein
MAFCVEATSGTTANGGDSGSVFGSIGNSSMQRRGRRNTRRPLLCLGLTADFMEPEVNVAATTEHRADIPVIPAGIERVVARVGLHESKVQNQVWYSKHGGDATVVSAIRLW